MHLKSDDSLLRGQGSKFYRSILVIFHSVDIQKLRLDLFNSPENNSSTIVNRKTARLSAIYVGPRAAMVT
jgi:hypothetical protein